MTAVVDENALMHLNVGDFVAILTHHMKDGKMHWTLGSVETPPYLRDVEIRLWERQRVEYYNEDETPANAETAALMERIAQVKADLQKSIEQSEALTQELRERRAAIMQQIADAERYVQESRAVGNAARDDVESIPDRHWQELKSYRIPPKMVSVVIRAVMLLLSEDEARTWPQMQRVLRDFNFKRRITSYDPEQQLSPERRDYILQECVSKKSFRYDRAMQGSVAVGPIYYWVLAQLDCGEAQSQKKRVDQEKIARQKELREVLKQISEQQKRITEYQELMDDLDDQLRMCNQRNDSSVSRARRRSCAGADRYADSFAAREGKEYLKSAFYTWKPTDRVIIVLRKNIVCNFNAVTTKEQEEGYNLSDAQIHVLDEALARRQLDADNLSDDEGLEDDMFRQNDAEAGGARDDDEIMKERELQAAAGGAVPSSEAKAKLQRTFEGKNWQRVLDRKRDAIEAAFVEESAECLEVPEYYISIEDLTIGSLIVDFFAQHDGTRATEELQSCVDACGYPKVMALYEEDDEEPEHQMKFGGDRWGDIVPAHRQEIEEAFAIDTSAATGAPREEIEVQDIRVEEDGLEVDYSMADKSRDPDEVQEQVDAYSYPEVWALYQRLAGLDEAGPTHQVRFRGERWADIMEGNEEAIQAAFAEDTAAALGIEPEQVIPDEMRYENGLTVPYTVSGCSLSDDEVDSKAEDYGYPKTWALYDRLVAEAVGADFQKAFEGKHWEAVLQVARSEVSEAFCADTANAVHSAPAQVDPRSVDTDQDRLLVSYNVVDTAVRAEEVREDTREYPYPEVWALYQQVIVDEAEGTDSMSKRFDGESWKAINRAITRKVRAAFTKDVCDATGVDAKCVVITDVKTSMKGMVIEYGVTRNEGESAHAVRKALRESQYPATWALYEESKGLYSLGDRESGILERRFEGDDWDILVEACPELLNEAFQKDAARTLGVPAKNVRIISTEIGSLIVKYQIVEPSVEDAEIERRINDDDFPELMALYRARVRGGDDGEGGKRGGQNLDNLPKKVFDGEEWDMVLDEKRAQLEQAFQQDTAEALNVDADQVVVNNMEADAYALQVSYSVQGCPVDAAAAQESVSDYAYPNVWELYPSEEEAGRHEKVFPGSAWAAVVSERKTDVKSAFQQDVAECLGVDEKAVDVRSVRVTPEGLAVRYNVDEQQCDAAQVEPACATCTYPKTWALYEEEGEKDWVVTSHQVGFDGDDWVYVVEDKLPELQAAFVGCTAELFCLRMENVKEAKYSLGSLIVDFQLKHPAELTEDDINTELNLCPYEPVWDLYGYHPWDPKETMHTTHEVGFEGTGWAVVLANHKEQLEAAFQRDTATALETQPEDVCIDSAEYAEDCLLVKTTVTHHIFQDNELMQEQLSRFPYDEVWALYEDDPDAGWVTTSHQVGFDGDDWGYVLSANKEALETAFRNSTGEALDLNDDHLSNLVMEATEESLLVTFDIKHPIEQTEDEVNQRLADCPYVAVWDLYIDHPYNPDEVETTAHEIGFEGDEWDKVIATQPEQLQEAIMLDTAEALDVTPNDVMNIQSNFKDGNLLVVTMDVMHPLLQDNDLIKEQLGRFPYDRVWALYEDAPLAAVVRESGILERRFEGDDWDILVEGCPELLNEAFKKDAARTLGVPAKNVRVISTEIGSLIVKYQIVNPACDDAEIQQQVDADEFPEVMGLYRRRIRGGDGGEGGVFGARGMQAGDAEDAGAYRKDFPGDNWEECVRNSRADIEAAFAKDTADATGVAGPRVVVRSVRTDDEGMYVGYDVHDASGEEAAEGAAPVSADEVQEKTADYPYPGVWALYQDETITTAHALSFEARDWGYVVRRRRWELARAISDDSADATGLEPESVVDVRMEAHEENLSVTVYIVHARTMAVEDIDQSLAEAPFERVWALYELLAPSSEQVRTFKGSRWPEVEAAHHAELKRAFAEDTAKAMCVSRLEVEVHDMSVSAAAGLKVTYVVRGSSLQDDEVEEAARKCPYPHVWRIYGGAAAGQRDFEGDSWESVLDAKHDEVEEAFRVDTANALGVAQDEIEVYQTTADESGLHVQYGQRPSEGEENREAEAAAAAKVQQYDYPHLWNLYNETQGAAGFGGRGDRESGQLQRVFPGDDWDIVLEGCPEEANDAFRKGVADVAGVSKRDVVVLNSRIGSLVMDYKVRNCDMEDDEINRKAADHDFPELMELYRARVRGGDSGAAGGPSSATTHQVGFDGEDWAYALKTNEAAIHEAFAADSAEQLGCAPSKIRNIRTTIDTQMLVEFDVDHPASQTEDEVDDLLKNCSYERVWELYGVHPYDDSEKVTTEHDIGFEGDDWDYVIENDREEMERTFKAATGNAITVPASDVHDLKIERSDDGIVITCQLTHNRNRNHEVLQEELQNYPYEEMWALYRTRPYDENEKVTTSHELTFEGDAWEVVCEVQREELRRAVIEDTAAALGVEDADVVDVKNTASATGLVTRMKVRHSPLQDDDLIQEELARYEFEHVWALYESSVETRLMSKTFAGAQWPTKMKTRRAEVHNAFRIDTSNMLNLPPRFVDVKNSTSNTKDGLTIEYTVLGEWFKEEEIERRSATYAYPEVWRCYQGSGPRVATDFVKTFPGTAWAYVTEKKSYELKKAFQIDTAEAMADVKPTEVAVTGVEANEEELCVTFTAPTALGANEKAKADASLEDHPYPSVWELYPSEEELAGFGGRGDRESGQLQRVFPGDDWDIVLEGCPEEANSAFQKGVADSVGGSASDVVVVKASLGSLIMDYKVRNCDMEDDEITRKAADHDFPELMELYRARVRAHGEQEGQKGPLYPDEPTRATLQDCGFEGEDWDYVWGNKKEEVCAAFAKGCADAIGVAAEDIEDVSMEQSADGIVLGANVTHPLSQNYHWIQRALRDHPFEELWALYETRPYDPNDLIDTEHTISFEGEEWGFVMENKRPDVIAAIRLDTAEALALEENSVLQVTPTVSATGLAVVIVVRHSPLQDDELIQEELSKYEYERVWALYCPEGEAPHGRKHFDGINWVNVIKTDMDGVIAAFREDTATATNVQPSDIEVSEVTADEAGMTVRYVVNFASTSAAATDRILQTYPYPNVWDHYRTAADRGVSAVIIVDAEEEEELPAGYARVALSVSFEGELWERVVRERAQRLTDAFRADTASAISAKLADIHIREYVVSSESVLVHFSARYEESMDETDLREKVDEHPYGDVWALYDEVEDLVNAAAGSVFVKRFDGVDWDLALEEYPAKVEAAFCADTAAVLQTTAAHVSVDSMVTGSLIIHFRVSGVSLPIERITSLVDNYAYPKLWALYISRETA